MKHLRGSNNLTRCGKRPFLWRKVTPRLAECECYDCYRARLAEYKAEARAELAAHDRELRAIKKAQATE